MMTKKTIRETFKGLKVKADYFKDEIDYYCFVNKEENNATIKKWLEENNLWTIAVGSDWTQYGLGKMTINFFCRGINA